MTNPRPRPAFSATTRTGRDVAAVVAVPPPRAVDLDRPTKPKQGKQSKRGDGPKHHHASGPQDKQVTVVVQLPKPVRKRLRAKAADLGMTAEEAAAHVLRMWVDG